MGRLAFAGLAVLFPITLAIIRWGGVPTIFGLLSIIVGELLLIGFYYGFIPETYLFGFDRSIIVLLVCFLIVGIGKLFGKRYTSSG